MKQPSSGLPAHQLRRLAVITAAAFALSAGAQTYPAWAPDTYYTAGTVVTYNGRLYRATVNQTDYASTGWNPTNASLWTDLGATSGPAPS
jgi:chitodextrinase